MDKRKELKEQYKQSKPDMGVFVIRCLENGKCHLEAVKNLNGRINRAKFQLGFNSYPVKELQADWNQFGPARFEFEVLEKLDYDKDESKTDYSEELEILKLMWKERLLNQNITLYQK